LQKKSILKPLFNTTKISDCKPIIVDDSEENSFGDYSDEGFWVESMSTESDELDCQTHLNFQNPLDMILKDYYQKNLKQVIDVCVFSNTVLYLTKNKGIYSYCGNEVKKIDLNCQLKRIVSCFGDLYGLTKQGLVILNLDYYDHSFWVFTKVKWAPSNILDIQTTLDYNTLWIQTNKHSYLIDCHGYKTKVKTNYKRVYGNNTSTYLEFNKSNQCHIVINNQCVETVNNVISGVIDDNNGIYFVDINQQYLYKDIQLINNKPYYINL
jgi:hypothetical protein